jgi:hypothetical protein
MLFMPHFHSRHPNQIEDERPIENLDKRLSKAYSTFIHYSGSNMDGEGIYFKLNNLQKCDIYGLFEVSEVGLFEGQHPLCFVKSFDK